MNNMTLVCGEGPIVAGPIAVLIRFSQCSPRVPSVHFSFIVLGLASGIFSSGTPV